eukprot:TRINITY_DN27030_c0_g1_i1.p1 TRINITY_DN27030_c0_g1~~TRINITY_DN27030_c0_g1_i1.p1  ORF type:complete len:502 (+),score=115.70 TRINITY_DN27030_c0_g1_i1:34-1539(+)
MPLLWGLFSLPTVSEFGIAAMLGKIGAGCIGGMPGYYWPADRTIRGLAFLRMPSEEELKAHDLHKKKAPMALSCDSLVKGDLYSLPFSTGFMVLVNAMILLTAIYPLRWLWDEAMTHSPPQGMVRALNFSPSDTGAAAVLLISVTMLLGLQRTCYSNKEAVGMGGTYAALVAAIAAFGVICTEEITALQFGFHASLLDFNSYLEGFQVRHEVAPWYYSLTLPGYLTSSLLSTLCIFVSYGLTSATWRLVRCHYQHSDRAASSLASIEEARAKFLLEYKLGKVNVQDGDQQQPPTNPLDKATVAEQYYTFFLKLLSWVSLTLPFMIASTFVGSERFTADVKHMRLWLCVMLIASRLWLFRPYLQTYLHRDVNEAMMQSKNSKQFAEVLSGVHTRAVALLARTSILLMAPIGVYLALTVLSHRLLDTPATDNPEHILANIFAPRLVASEYAAPEDVAPKAFFANVVGIAMFWMAASESFFILFYCTYRWGLRFLNNILPKKRQ